MSKTALFLARKSAQLFLFERKSCKKKQRDSPSHSRFGRSQASLPKLLALGVSLHSLHPPPAAVVRSLAARPLGFPVAR